MSLYKISLIIADILCVILIAIWLVYNIGQIDTTEIMYNYAIVILSLYVSVGNLIYIYNK